MTARRTKAMRELAEREQAAKARADEVIREATEHAQRIITDARQAVDVLHRHRDRVADGLRAARRLLADAEPLLRPAPGKPGEAAA